MTMLSSLTKKKNCTSLTFIKKMSSEFIVMSYKMVFTEKNSTFGKAVASPIE